MPGCRRRHLCILGTGTALVPSGRVLSLPAPLSRDTSGWKAWHESGRRRSFWERIRSHFTEALCARLLRTGSAGKERGWMPPTPRGLRCKLGWL